MRKILFTFIMLLMLSFMLIACTTDPSDNPDDEKPIEQTPGETDPDDDKPKDTKAPVFKDIYDGFLSDVEHLAHMTFDLFEGVVVTDDVTPSNSILLEIIDDGGYQNDIPGVYTITIQASDNAGNKSTAKRDVYVIDGLMIQTYKLFINDDELAVSVNEEEALMYTSSGTKFRSKDVIQLMTKEFFLAEYDKYKAAHTNNGGVPYMNNGALIVVDPSMKIKLVRVSSGSVFEIDENNEMKQDSQLNWNSGINASSGSGMLKNIPTLLETLIPEGGFIIFAPGKDPYDARMALISRVFSSVYTTGAVNKDIRDIDIREVKVDIHQDSDYVPMPPRLTTPSIKLYKNMLTWEAIPNATKYLIYVDGKEFAQIEGTNLSLDLLSLVESPKNGTAYEIEVQAVPDNTGKNGLSYLSNKVLYKKVTFSETQTPVITKNGNEISWNLIDGASSYDIYFTIGTVSLKAGNVTTNAFDLTTFETLFPGVSKVSVIAIGDDTHFDSNESNQIEVTLGKVETLVINGYKVDVLRTGALNYFVRRNLSYATQNGFNGAPYLFLIVDPMTLNESHKNVEFKESYGSIVLLENDFTVKMINSTGTGKSWNILDGWYQNKFYKSNAEQIESIIHSIYSGDYLLIGKYANLLNVTTPTDSVIINVDAREFVNHFYVKDNGAEFKDEAWRGDMSTFLDPRNVTFEIIEKVIIVTEKLETPEISIEEDILSWEEISNAGTYYIYVDGIKVHETTGLFIDMKELNLKASPDGISYTVEVMAIPQDMIHYEISEKSNQVTYVQFGEEEPEQPEFYTHMKVNNVEVAVTFNMENAFNRLSSGAAFRSKDEIQVMTKEHFLAEFEKHAGSYADSNGNVFFPNGVLLIVDKNLNVKLLRVGVGITAEVNENDEVKTSSLGWGNTQATGGGFANLVGERLESLIPDGGYLIFAPATTNNISRTWMVKNLFHSGYQSGATAVANKDIRVSEVKLELLDRS
ncbi:hypothetical protein [Acholeplasma hippikon]|uniref:Pesticidal crystal protein Cry22Aa Ig-like domain-containing protein n=1 Tax=Acholeplasma hippikon TaxID=264636 RepID=A0A449BIA9_9MOLU|nr:hypothetical protein [Acholeplasma hippikon]VEU82185.1 Uncharacterised protein [Acholeplasma hippikon]